MLPGSVNESFRMLRPCQAKAAFALRENALGTAVMHVIEGEYCDSGMTVLGVVPDEEGPTGNGLERKNRPAA